MNILHKIHLHIPLLLMIFWGLCNLKSVSAVFTTAGVSSIYSLEQSIDTSSANNVDHTTKGHFNPIISDNVQITPTVPKQDITTITRHNGLFPVTNTHQGIIESTSALGINIGSEIFTSDSGINTEGLKLSSDSLNDIRSLKSTSNSRTYSESTVLTFYSRTSDSRTNIGSKQLTSDTRTYSGSTESTSYPPSSDKRVNIGLTESTFDTLTSIGTIDSFPSSRTKKYPTTDQTTTEITTTQDYYSSYNSRRGFTWIAYIIVCILTIPAIIAYTYYQIKGMRKKEILDRELSKL